MENHHRSSRWSVNWTGKRSATFLHQFWQRYWLLLLIGLPTLIGTFYYAYHKSNSGEDAFPIQILCFIVAFAWVAYTARHSLQPVIHIDFQNLRIHPAWLLVLLAIVLRYATISIYPPAGQTLFEESQTGNIAYRILLTHVLPIEFRFTNLLAALGLSTGSEINLSAMRLPFQVAGIVSLLLLLFSLRSLKIKWIPALFVVFIAATLRFIVIGAGVADELFAGTTFVTALLFCLIKADTSQNNDQPIWTALAGIFAGILMYEYISFRIAIVFAAIYLLWKCLFGIKDQEGTPKSRAWFNLLSFLITLILIALPTIVQTVQNPVESVFLEAFRRHGGERSTLLVSNYAFQIKQYLLGLTGWPSAVSAFYGPINEPVILAPIGWLFGLSFLFSLIFPPHRFLRGLAITVILTVFDASIAANNYNIGRMAPIIPMLLIMTGVFLNSLYVKLTEWGENFPYQKKITLFIPKSSLIQNRIVSPPDSYLIKTQEAQNVSPGSYRQVDINLPRIFQLTIKVLVSAVFIILLGEMAVANIQSLQQMMHNKQVINEYANEAYSVCAHIGLVVTPHQRVYLYSSDGMGLCAPDPVDGWFFGGKQPEIHNSTDQPVSVNALVPGDLVVFGTGNRGLSEEEISQLIKLANETNSITSLRFSKNLAGRTTVGSICIQCKNQLPGE
jgi:hypothetical protein